MLNEVFVFNIIFTVIWLFVLLYASRQYFLAQSSSLLMRMVFLLLSLFSLRYFIVYLCLGIDEAIVQGYISHQHPLYFLAQTHTQMMQVIDVIVSITILLLISFGWFQHQNDDIVETIKSQELLKSDVQYLEQTSQHQDNLIHLHQIVSKIKKELIEKSTKDALLKEVCQGLGSYEFYKVVWIGLKSGQSSRINVAYKVDYAEPPYLEDDFYVNLNDKDIHSHGPVAESMRSKKVVHIKDTQKDPRFQAWKHRAKFSRIGEVLSLPMKLYQQEALFGVLSIYCDSGYTFSDEEMLLLEEMVQSVSSAIAFHEADNLRKETQHKLKMSAQLLEKIVSTVPLRLFWKDTSLVYLGCNDLFAQDAGIANEAGIIGKKDTELVWKNNAQEYNADDREVIQTKKPIINRIERQGKMWLLTNKAPLFDEHNEVIGLVGAYIDITYQKEAERYLKENEQRFRELMNAMPNIAIQGYNKKREVIYWNKQSEALYGYSEEEALGKRLENLIIPEAMRDMVIAGVDNWIVNHEPVPNGELILKRKDGSDIAVYSSHLLLDSDKENPEMFCIDIDLTQQKEADKALQYLANYDALTGLPNRHYFFNYMHSLFNKAQRSPITFALLFIDLDDFKMINDSYGHEYGDYVLEQTAKRFQSILRDYDFIARYGGDEFVVCIEYDGDVNLLSSIAEKIVQIIRKPFMFKEATLKIGSSIGICRYPKNADNFETLLKYADHAMYKAKEKGKNQYDYCDKSTKEG